MPLNDIINMIIDKFQIYENLTKLSDIDKFTIFECYTFETINGEVVRTEVVV